MQEPNKYEAIRLELKKWQSATEQLKPVEFLSRGGLEELIHFWAYQDKNKFLLFFDPAKDDIQNIYPKFSYVRNLFLDKLKIKNIKFWAFDQSQQRSPKNLEGKYGIFACIKFKGKKHPTFLKMKLSLNKDNFVGEFVKFILMQSSIRMNIPSNYIPDEEDRSNGVGANLLLLGEDEKEDL